MHSKQYLLYGFGSLLFCSCSTKPSEADIKRKIVLDYSCPETVEVNRITINSLKESTSFIGLKGYECTVSGEVSWKDGCNEYGSFHPAGFIEKFENKKVILINGDEGWR